MTRKELLDFESKQMASVYTVEKSTPLITHSFTVISPNISLKFVQWFNDTNGSRFAPSTEAILFGNLNSGLHH